jgi:hypothetical protein
MKAQETILIQVQSVLKVNTVTIPKTNIRILVPVKRDGTCICFSQPRTYTRPVKGPHSYLSERQPTSPPDF